MKTNKLTFLLLAALILTFTLASCGEKEKETLSGNTYNGQALKSGTPTSATLTKYGISESTLGGVFASARAVNTSDADYQGYVEMTETEDGTTMSMLYFIWINKTEAKYNAVSASLSQELSYTMTIDPGDYTDDFPANTVKATGGAYDISSDYKNMKVGVCIFYLKTYDDVPPELLL